MANQETARAVSLYLPKARFHMSNGSVRGRRFIQTELDRSPMLGVDPKATQLSGFDRFVKIETQLTDVVYNIYLEIEQGLIVEQWNDVAPELPSEEEGFSIKVLRRGDVPDEAASYAEERILQLIDRFGKPIEFVEVKLTMATNPSYYRPARVEAKIMFDKSLVRAHASSETFEEATALICDRIRIQIEHQQANRRQTMPLQAAFEHRKKLDDGSQNLYNDLPEEDREIVRHKSFAADEMTVEEAVWDMTVLDYDFFLFIELATGLDCIIQLDSQGELSLQRLESNPDMDDSIVDEMTVIETVVPSITVDEAINHLNQTNHSRVFFRNSLSGRGNVLYRRFDGHYGLVTPLLD